MELQSFNKDGTRTSSKLELESERKSLPGIHTFSTDAHDVIEREDASLLRIHLAEKKKNLVQSEYSITKIVTVFVVLGLIIATISILIWFFVFKEKQMITSQPVLYNPQTLMNYDSITPFAGGDIKTHINNVWATSTLGYHYIEILNASNTPVTISEFATLSNTDISNQIKKIATGPIMLGSKNSGDGSYPFLLLKYNNRNQTLATMYQAEELLPQIMREIFDIETYGSKAFSDIPASNNTVRGFEQNGVFIGWGMNENFIVISTEKDMLLNILYKSKM